MPPVATVHVADLPVRTALSMLAGRPAIPEDSAGLVHADVASAAPLRKGSLPNAQPRRIAAISFWQSREAADRWAADNSDAPIMSGWRAVLEPLRAFGAWPGLPNDIAHSRTTAYDGPSVVLTLGRLRMPQFLRFLRTSKPAEQAALAADGMVWGTAMTRPPFVATCSLWESTQALKEYAYGGGEEPHPTAIAADRKKGFHHQSAFIRFKPLAVEGSLGGRNPISASCADIMTAEPPAA